MNLLDFDHFHYLHFKVCFKYLYKVMNLKQRKKFSKTINKEK